MRICRIAGCAGVDGRFRFHHIVWHQGHGRLHRAEHEADLVVEVVSGHGGVEKA